MKLMNKSLKSIVAAIAVMFLTVGCAPANTLSAANAGTDLTAGVAANLLPFYNQTVNWNTCNTNMKCGTVNVPLDWSNPSKGTLHLAVIFHDPTGSSLGSLFMNPGGPGGSGFDFIRDSMSSAASAAVVKRYRMVGWDPRGVGQSDPVKCLSAKETDKMLYDVSGYPVNSAKDIAAAKAQHAQFLAACKKNTGVELEYVDTVSAARDMDILRVVMGEPKLNLLGYSYGSFLGETYAALYPQNVGKFVLDGAMDPTVSDEQQSLNQLVGFDSAFKAYLAASVTQANSPFYGQTVDQAISRIKAFLLKLETTTLPTNDGRKLTESSALTGMLFTLYSKSYWKYMTQGFSQAFKGDGTTFILLADAYNNRNQDGSYTGNELESNIAVNCLDNRSSAVTADMVAQNAKVMAASSLLGRYWQWGGLGCLNWPKQHTVSPKSYAATGAGPILVLGTTNDPATPYKQAVHMAQIISSAHLVTLHGEGHTAYIQGNACIDKAVDGYLLNGTVPAKDPDCK
jgi:pimeloyl-ACP methyl ester carboxylesterase